MTAATHVQAFPPRPATVCHPWMLPRSELRTGCSRACWWQRGGRAPPRTSGARGSRLALVERAAGPVPSRARAAVEQDIAADLAADHAAHERADHDERGQRPHDQPVLVRRLHMQVVHPAEVVRARGHRTAGCLRKFNAAGARGQFTAVQLCPIR